MFRPRWSLQYRVSHTSQRGLLLPPLVATCYHRQSDVQTAQRECSECQSAIRNTTARHTSRHWFCIRTNCSSRFGNTTGFSILFNCSENSSSLLGCIISIICNASISNHQIRQVPSRHAINKASTWDHRLKRTPYTNKDLSTFYALRYQTCLYETVNQNARTMPATFALLSSKDRGRDQI